MDSLTNPLIQCKHCSTHYRKSDEAEHMKTCIDMFSLGTCPHCNQLFPESSLQSHIQTHSTIEPSQQQIDSLGFVDLTEEFNKQIEHELIMKKLYGDNAEHLRDGSKKKSFKKNLINFLYRNKLRFVGLGLATAGFTVMHTDALFFGFCMMLGGGTSTNYYEDKDVTASQVINLLPVSDVEEDNKLSSELKCVICLEEFAAGDKFTALPCLHLYHFECIENYLKSKMQCPVCKLKITKECFEDFK